MAQKPDLADLRREYNLTGLRRADLEPEPIAQFKKWFAQATGQRRSGRVRKFLIRLYKSVLQMDIPEQLDLNAMTLSTVDAQGKPSARIVLLKGVDPRGFVFFTNYNSRKGRELDQNPSASLVFYWQEQERQVCVAGTASKLPGDESDAYFQSRPHGSQVGAWASDQSQVVNDRADLEQKWSEFEKKFASGKVPRPAHWGGYLVRPDRVEFWQGRPNRLHDRFRYTRLPDNSWKIERLSP
jgi:pyridoxamine 5'-phosphate oxidase